MRVTVVTILNELQVLVFKQVPGRTQTMDGGVVALHEAKARIAALRGIPRSSKHHFTSKKHFVTSSWGIPRQIEPDFRIFCMTICDFDETWSTGYF